MRTDVIVYRVTASLVNPPDFVVHHDLFPVRHKVAERYVIIILRLTVELNGRALM